MMPRSGPEWALPQYRVIHLAWVAMFLNILNWRLRDVVTQGAGDIWDVYRVGLAAIAGLLAVHTILKSSGRLHQALSLPMVMLLLYGMVALVSSTLVSSSVSFYSMWKGIEVTTVAVVMTAVLTSREPQRAALAAYRLIVVLMSCLLVLYALEAAIWPGEAFTDSRGVVPVILRGVMPITQQNALGFYSAVVALAAIAGFSRVTGAGARIALLVLLAVALGELILAQSRTSVVGFVLALLAYLVFSGRVKATLALILVAVGGAMAWGLSELVLDYLRRGQSDELVTTLSGRTVGWQRAWELFKESPVIGHGYVASARTEILGNLFSGGMSTLHGALFDVLVGVGLLGLTPWLTAVIVAGLRVLRVGRYLSRMPRKDKVRTIHGEMVALLVLIAVRSSTSSGLAIHDHTYMLFLCLVGYGAGMHLHFRTHRKQVVARAAAPALNGAVRQ